MTITATGFGWIETTVGRFEHDIVIFPDGRVANRYDQLVGSNHLVSVAEAETVLAGTNADLVVGTGQHGVVQVPAATRTALKQLGVRLHTASTPEAIRIYNTLDRLKCAIIHVTC